LALLELTQPRKDTPTLTTPRPASDQSARARVDALNDLAWQQWRSDSKNALSLCEEARTLAKILNYQLGLARGLNVRSRCHLRLANPEAALKDASEALAQFQALADQEGTEDAFTTFGVIELDRGHFTEALSHFLAAHRLCKGRGDKREAVALGNLGVVHDYLGDYAISLDYHRRSWSVSKRCGDNALGEKVSQNNVGYMNYRLGQYEGALTHYFSALTLEHVGDQQLHALLLDNIGLAYEKLGDYPSSLNYQQESLKIREATGDRWGIGDSLDGLGSAYLALGKTDEAQGRLERSLALKEEVGNKKGQAETCILLGTLMAREGRLERALDYLHRALETAEGITSQEDICKAHCALAEAYKLGGRFRKALEHHETCHEIREGLLNEVSNRKLQTLRVRFETDQAEKEKELYRMKNVELAAVNHELELLTASLREADQEKSALMVQLEKQAKEDSLTGLYNRRHFDAQLAQEFTRARRFKRPLSVALCDVDNFKMINDRFLHTGGDAVLKAIAAILATILRSGDVVARIGGEEFAFIFPETAGPEARAICERVRHDVETYPWNHLYQDLQITVSIGLSHDTSVANAEEMLAQADVRLYEAKQQGKNRVHA